jgi:hypothetical protein
MFPCACSLRSTQCAALIALAAAAGIMRIQPAQPERAQANRPDAGNLKSQLAPKIFDTTSHFQVKESAAPWLHFVQLVSDLAAESDGEAVPALSPPTEVGARLDFPSSVWLPSARQHSFPYAVGPPASGHTWTSRADDTWVSGDSVARRGYVSRIALDLTPKFSARATRRGNPGLTMAGAFPQPNSALRGEPVALSLLHHDQPRRPRCAVALHSPREEPHPRAPSLFFGRVPGRFAAFTRKLINLT